MNRIIAACTLAFVAACATSKIGGTEIDDTEENREILSLVEAYHRALESLDADAVLALVSPEYYEDNGNADTSDDYDYEALARTLHADFERTRSLQIEIRVDDIQVEDESAYAELYYDIRAQNEYPSGVKWERTADRTRLQLQRVGENWRIVSGL